MSRNNNSLSARLAVVGIAWALLVTVGFGSVAAGAGAQAKSGASAIQSAASARAVPSPRTDPKTEDPILSKECHVGSDGVLTADVLDISETKDGRRMVICTDHPKRAGRS